MAGLENYLSDLLGVPVDLSPANMLKEPVRKKATQEAVLASSKEPGLHFCDILEAIQLIEQFTRGFDLQTFSEDLRTIAAVERKLQEISEAAVRLGDDAERLCPGAAVAEYSWHWQLVASRV